MNDTRNYMIQIGQKARAAARELAKTPAPAKTAAMVAIADSVRANLSSILEANATDMRKGQANGLSKAALDRLLLTESRVDSIIESVLAISRLDEPVGQLIDSWNRPNGLKIERISTPIGVIGIIYESRPNVTVDAGCLCFKSGNAAILRGGSDSFQSSLAMHSCLVEGLLASGLSPQMIQFVETTDRDAVGEMLAGLDGNLDLVVPRGGKALVSRVQADARVPVLAHLEGICHVYVDGDALVEMAVEVVLNSKMRRPGICGAAETLLVDSQAVETHLLPVLTKLSEQGCEIRGDQLVCEQFPDAIPASSADWATEYLDTIISVRIVNGVDEAIAHIETYSSGHTESIVTQNAAKAEKFLSQVDSAIVLHNASTQFADGGEFGMGAEIGIATGRVHARGPVGAQQLTTFKYRVHGNGQTRP